MGQYRVTQFHIIVDVLGGYSEGTQEMSEKLFSYYELGF